MSLSRDHRLSFKHLGVHDIRSILYCCLTKSQYFSGSRILADYTFFHPQFPVYAPYGGTLVWSMEVHWYGVWSVMADVWQVYRIVFHTVGRYNPGDGIEA